MGYYSDVFYSVSHQGWHHLIRLCKETCSVPEQDTFKCQHLFCWHRLPAIVSSQWNGVVFGWKEIKWYGDVFDDVGHVQYLIKELDKAGYSHNYARVGEDYEDSELEIDDDCDPPLPVLSIERQIVCSE